MNEYINLNNGHTMIKITGNKYEGDIIVSTEDVEKLKLHSWYIKYSANGNKYYVHAKVNNKTVKLHRFLFDNLEKDKIIDHIDRDTFNNTRENLRIADYRMNNTNTAKRKTNTSGRTGVYLYHSDNNIGRRSDSFVGSYYDSNGKRHTRNYSIKKYGYKKAFKLAEEFRSKGEKEFGILTEK